MMCKFNLVLIVVLSLISSHAFSVKTLFIEPYRLLPDGQYVIERRTLQPFGGRGGGTGVTSESVAYDVHSEYFQFFLRGEDFIVRQMIPGDDGFIPKGNFFAGISDEGSWYFVEASNTVNIYSQRYRRGMDLGLIHGLMDTTFRFGEELKLLGLHELDLASVNSTGAGRFDGSTTSGQALTGTIFKNDNDLIERIEYEVFSGRQFRIEFLRNSSQYIISGSSVATRESDAEDGWEVGYTIIDSSSLPTDMNMFRYWEEAADPDYIVLEYDSSSNELVHVDAGGERRVLGNLPHSFQDLPEDSGLPLTLIIVLVVAGTLPVILLVFSQSRCFGSAGKNKKQG